MCGDLCETACFFKRAMTIALCWSVLRRVARANNLVLILSPRSDAGAGPNMCRSQIETSHGQFLVAALRISHTEEDV